MINETLKARQEGREALDDLAEQGDASGKGISERSLDPYYGSIILPWAYDRWHRDNYGTPDNHHGF